MIHKLPQIEFARCYSDRRDSKKGPGTRDSCAELQGFGPQRRSMSTRLSSSTGWVARSRIEDRTIPECFTRADRVWDSLSADSLSSISLRKDISRCPHPQAATSSSLMARFTTLKRSGSSWEYKHGE